MNTREYANQPALELGVKTGGEALCASAGTPKPARQAAPARTAFVTFPAYLDIGSSPAAWSINIEEETTPAQA
jgi:hypothetical protein